MPVIRFNLPPWPVRQLPQQLTDQEVLLWLPRGYLYPYRHLLPIPPPVYIRPPIPWTSEEFIPEVIGWAPVGPLTARVVQPAVQFLIPPSVRLTDQEVISWLPAGPPKYPSLQPWQTNQTRLPFTLDVQPSAGEDWFPPASRVLPTLAAWQPPAPARPKAPLYLGYTRTSQVAVGTGTGYVDVNPKQIIRTVGNRVYIFASDCASYPCEATGQTIRAYRGDQTGIPTSFTRQNSAGEPSGVAGWAIALDGSGVIHVAWTFRTALGGTLDGLRYTTYDTGTDTWSGTVETIISGGLTDGVGQGNQTIALALDASGIPHIVYLSGNGTARRINYRNRAGGSWSAATQVDSGVSYTVNLRAWHPNIAFDTAGRALTAWLRGSFNEDNDGTIYTRVRQASGTFDTEVNVSGTAAARTTIDQSTSLLVTSDNRYHITYTQQPDSYIRYAYSDDEGLTWTFSNPGNGTRATHNPSLGPGPGGSIRIYGHGVPVPSPAGHGDDIRYSESFNRGETWGSHDLFFASTVVDSSINTRWSTNFHFHPNIFDIAYWNQNYPNDLYYGADDAGTSFDWVSSGPLSFRTLDEVQFVLPLALRPTLTDSEVLTWIVTGPLRRQQIPPVTFTLPASVRARLLDVPAGTDWFTVGPPKYPSLKAAQHNLVSLTVRRLPVSVLMTPNWFPVGPKRFHVLKPVQPFYIWPPRRLNIPATIFPEWFTIGPPVYPPLGDISISRVHLWLPSRFFIHPPPSVSYRVWGLAVKLTEVTGLSRKKGT